MNRREVITLLGGAAAWPLAARAQQRKLPIIGFLGGGTSSSWNQWATAFIQQLRQLGWIDGRTIAIEFRWAEGRSERYAVIAAEFVRLKVDVIVTSGGAALVAKQITSDIPIVFAVASNPIGSGLVASLATRWQRHRTFSSGARSSEQADRIVAGGCSEFAPVGDDGQCRLSGGARGDERG